MRNIIQPPDVVAAAAAAGDVAVLKRSG